MVLLVGSVCVSRGRFGLCYFSVSLIIINTVGKINTEHIKKTNKSILLMVIISPIIALAIVCIIDVAVNVAITVKIVFMVFLVCLFLNSQIYIVFWAGCFLGVFVVFLYFWAVFVVLFSRCVCILETIIIMQY